MQRCMFCGRVLTANESLDRLVGPECAKRLAATRTDKSPLCLDKARTQLDEFLKRASSYLDNEAMTKLHQAATPLLQRILAYPGAMRAETLWAKATRNQQTVALETERAIEHLAKVAGDLAVGGEGDWRRNSEAWRPILSAMDHACGYDLVRRGTHLRLARLYRTKGLGRSGRSAAQPLPPLLALLEAPAPVETARPKAKAGPKVAPDPDLLDQPPLLEIPCATSSSISGTEQRLSAAPTRTATAWL